MSDGLHHRPPRTIFQVTNMDERILENNNLRERHDYLNIDEDREALYCMSCHIYMHPWDRLQPCARI